MNSSNIPTPKRVLVIAAHPDDAEFGCAATIAKWTSNGASAAYIVVTDGSKGTWDANIHPFELAIRREEEQRKACAVLGVEEVHFLRHRDGEVTATPDLRRELATWIRALKPDVVITHDPWKQYALHPDHREVGRLVCDAVVAARDPLYLAELTRAGVGSHRPSELLLWEPDRANHIEEVTDKFLDLKIEALLQHESQFESTMGFRERNPQNEAAFRQRILERAIADGKEAGFSMGEAFRRIDPAS